MEGGSQKSMYNADDIARAKELCEQLLHYGYEVCMNFGCGDIISDGEINMIASAFHTINLKAIYLADTYGGFNSHNVPIQLHKFYTAFDKYHSYPPFGFHAHNNNEDALNKTITAIYHGCGLVDSCIGGLGRGAGNLKSEQLISHMYGTDTEYMKIMTPLVLYFDRYILSKNDYCANHYVQSHPYYMISSVLSLHPNYIANILTAPADVEDDIRTMLALDRYTKERNERNYDKSLLKKLCVLEL